MKITNVDKEALTRAVRKSKGYAEREELRGRISSLTNDDVLELQPEDGESLRKIKVAAKWAAKDVGCSILYDETREGTLLVYLGSKPQPTPSPEGKKRGRPRKNPQAEGESTADQMGLEEVSNR